MKHRKSYLIAACAATALMVSGADARELVYGSWVSPKHGINVNALPPLFKGVAKDTNGSITWKLVAGGALVKGFTTLSGIRDGLIDAGLAISVFTPKNSPSTALIHSTLVAGDDNVATTGAQNEAVMLHCPSCLAEWKKNNVVYLAGYAPTPFRVMCRSKVETLADFKGKKGVCAKPMIINARNCSASRPTHCNLMRFRIGGQFVMIGEIRKNHP